MNAYTSEVSCIKCGENFKNARAFYKHNDTCTHTDKVAKTNANRLASGKCGKCGKGYPSRDTGWCVKCLDDATWLNESTEPDTISKLDPIIEWHADSGYVLPKSDTKRSANDGSSNVPLRGSQSLDPTSGQNTISLSPDSNKKTEGILLPQEKKPLEVRGRWMICEECEQEFRAQRRSARFCSQKCKARARRERSK